jgi:hypothetical protein
MNPVVLALMALAAEPKPADFAYGATLTDAEAPIVEITLPPWVYSAVTRNDLGDVRVFNAADQAVPTALRSAPLAEPDGPSITAPHFAIEAPPATPVNDLALTFKDHGRELLVSSKGLPPGPRELVAYVLDVSSAKRSATALELTWTDESVWARVDVSASDDLSSWRSVVSDAALADVKLGNHRLERRRLELGSVRARYLRVARRSGPLPKIERVTITLAADVPHVPRERLRLATTIMPDVDGQQAFLVDVGGPLPVIEAELALPESNTLATVAIDAGATAEGPFRQVAQGLTYRMTRAGTEVTSEPFAMPGVRLRFLRLRIDRQGGGIGAGSPALVVSYRPEQLLFVRRGDAPFSFVAGKFGAELHHRAADAIESAAGDGPNAIPAVTLGERETLAGEAARQEPAPPWPYKTWALWATLVLAVAVLGWMTLKVARQLGTTA